MEEVNWEAVKRLQQAAVKVAAAKFAELNTLLAKSDQLLSPLQDPLKLKFGLHRWMAGDREEAYSDWLAWVLDEMASPERVGRLLYGDAVPPELLACKSCCATDREVWVPTGHAGQAGRLDCVVRFGDEAVIVIEVKVVNAEAADTGKQTGYGEWLENTNAKFKSKILIAPDGDTAKEYEGEFKPFLWQDLCKRIRWLLPELIVEGRIASAALMAAFVGSVEQNILGFPYLARVGTGSDSDLLAMVGQLDTVTDYLRSILYKE